MSEPLDRRLTTLSVRVYELMKNTLIHPGASSSPKGALHGQEDEFVTEFAKLGRMARLADHGMRRYSGREFSACHHVETAENVIRTLRPAFGFIKSRSVGRVFFSVQSVRRAANDATLVRVQP